MKPRIKATWLKALRSGKYKQGASFLKYENRFCCLGVLYDTLKGHRWIREKHSKGRGAGKKGQCGLLDAETRSRCGLGHADQSTLAGMNDQGKSFGEIADYIEQKL